MSWPPDNVQVLRGVLQTPVGLSGKIEEIRKGDPGPQGPPGADGADGISPVISSESITGGHRLTIVDAGGTTTVDVMDGQDGQDGTNGVGVPTGGTTGQTLTKRSNTNYDTEWTTLTASDVGAQPQIAAGSVTLTAANWTGSGPYTQTVTVSGVTVTSSSKVDIQPDTTAINQLITDSVKALYIVNNAGTLTATAIGAAPTADLTVQVTVTEVS